MSLRPSFLSLATLVFLLPLACYCQEEVPTAVVPLDDVPQKFWDDDNNNVRRVAHDYLFGEYIAGKKCVYSDGNEFLKEVVVHNESIRFDREIEVPLPKGSQFAAGSFQQLVIRGENLKQLRVVAIAHSQTYGMMHFLEKADNECLVRMPPLPLPVEYLPEITLRFISAAPVVIDEVSFRSTQELSSDFDAYRESLDPFPIMKDKQFEMRRKVFVETMNRSFEEVATSLNENSEASAIVAVARITSGIHSININGVLADRRVSKLYEGLSRLDAEAAAKVAAANFVREFETFQADWKDAGVLPVQCLNAVEANLFLCSEFCSPKSVLEKLDRWSSWYERLKEAKGFQFRHSAEPDFLLVANLLTNMVIRERQMTLAQANQWLAATVTPVLSKGSPPPVLRQCALATSDWTPERADLIKYVPAFQSYKSLHNKETQKRVIELLRAEFD